MPALSRVGGHRPRARCDCRPRCWQLLSCGRVRVWSRALEIQAVAGVVATDDQGRIFLIRRASDGTWADPAGRLEPGETWAHAAIREFAEETGGAVELTGLLGVYSDPETQIHQYASGQKVHFVSVGFWGRVLSLGTPNPVEVSDMGWFLPDQLPQPMFPAAVPVLADAAAGLGTIAIR